MNDPTTTVITGIVLRLAANYGKALDDDDTLMALVQDWAEQLDGFEMRDIELARKGLMGDPRVTYFPTIGEYKRRVQLARLDRKREEGSGDGCPACVGSGGSIGWAPAGTDDDGYDYVDHCPNGCKPPPAHRPPAVSRRRRRGQVDVLPMPDRLGVGLAAARDALTHPDLSRPPVGGDVDF